MLELALTEHLPSVSPDKFQSELKLARRCGCGRQQTCGSPRWGQRRSAGIENVRMVGRDRDSEVGVVQDVENLSAKLHIETLRDPFDRIILKQRKVEIREARASKDVAPRIA